MCGIFGGFWRSGLATLDGRADKALRCLRARGPDDQGFEKHDAAGGVLGLGHTRLSVIDLTDQGHQPMDSSCGRYSLVFNGEIYNYKELRTQLIREAGASFESASDTEVLLAAWTFWGESCLERLDGMFAFSIFDRQQLTLTCVRDAFGIKPFMYLHDNERFVFASTQQALLQFVDNPAVNLQRSYDYLVHGTYDSDESTFITGVRHLSPGHVIVLDLASNKVVQHYRWWTPSTIERTDLSFDAAAEQLRELFLQSVRVQLRSDVPIGAALSGGVDSSAIVCAMRYLEPDLPINTFSYIASGTPYSEEQWVDIINNHVGACGHKIEVDGAELLADLDDLIVSQGEPFGSTSIYAQYRVSKLAREAGVVVTLDGQGADELLAGYSGYPGERIRSLLESGHPLDAVRFASQWAKWPNRRYAQAWMLYARQVLPDALYAGSRRITGKNFKPDWLNTQLLAAQGVDFSEPFRQRQSSGKGRRVVQTLAGSLQEKGLQALLRHGDRNSMRFSVESRVPFLSTGVAEFALSLPEHYLIAANGETKSVFKAAMRGIVPDSILDRKDKVGLVTPDQQWLQQGRDHLRNIITDAEDIPFINSQVLCAQFDAVMQGRGKFNWQVWRWINYIRWYRLTMG